MAKRRTIKELTDHNLRLQEACEIAQKSSDANHKKIKSLDKQSKQSQEEAGRLRGLLAAQGKHLGMLQQQSAAEANELRSKLEWTQKKRFECKRKHTAQAEEFERLLAQLDSLHEECSDLQEEKDTLKAALHITTKD